MSRLDSTAMVTISWLLGSNFQMPGGSASTGKSSRMRSRAARTSLAAAFRSVPWANSRFTRLAPSSELEVMRSTLGTLDTAFETGSVMMVSTSSGPTFG
jgi:hypothetical protein